MAVKTATIGDTVQFRDAGGSSRNVLVYGTQANSGAAPSAPAVANSGAGGVLTAATYSYRISRVRGGAETLASTAGTTVVGAGTTNKCTITLPGEAGASYRIYGRVGGSELFIGESAVGAVSFDDTGSVVTPAGALPATDGRIGIYDPHIDPEIRPLGGGAPILKATAKHGAGSTNVYFKY
jgi:hypothetical protein